MKSYLLLVMMASYQGVGYKYLLFKYNLDGLAILPNGTKIRLSPFDKQDEGTVNGHLVKVTMDGPVHYNCMDNINLGSNTQVFETLAMRLKNGGWVVSGPYDNWKDFEV